MGAACKSNALLQKGKGAVPRFFCLLFGFTLSWFLCNGMHDYSSTVVVDKPSKKQSPWVQHTNNRTVHPLVPLPIIVLGMPKAGTTTVYAYFECGGYRASHYQCGPPAEHGGKKNICGHCIYNNVRSGKPPLEGCGKFDVWAEMNAAQPPIYFPQVEALEELHNAYPNATFILNIRKPREWLRSVDNWQKYRQKLTMANITGLPAGVGKVDNDMIEFYNSHSDHVRRFAKDHPSHKLVEFQLEDPSTAATMASEFGIPQECWGHQNKNEKVNG